MSANDDPKRTSGTQTWRRRILGVQSGSQLNDSQTHSHLCGSGRLINPDTNVRRARRWSGETTHWPRVAQRSNVGRVALRSGVGGAPDGATLVGMAVRDGVGIGGVVAGGEVMG